MIAWAQQILEDHGSLFGWIALGSGVLLLASLASLPLIAAMLPADYLVSHGRKSLKPPAHPLWQGFLLVLKNVAGILLILAGVLMLVLPGQGLLTILLGLLLVNVPGKQKFERRVVGSPRVLKMLNRMRQRFGRPAMLAPPRQRD